MSRRLLETKFPRFRMDWDGWLLVSKSGLVGEGLNEIYQIGKGECIWVYGDVKQWIHGFGDDPPASNDE